MSIYTTSKRCAVQNTRSRPSAKRHSFRFPELVILSEEDNLLPWPEGAQVLRTSPGGHELAPFFVRASTEQVIDEVEELRS